MSDDENDEEGKLPTSKKLPTSEGGDEDKGEEKPQTVIVDYGGGIIVHRRLPDGTLDEGREFSTEELIPNEDEGSPVWTKVCGQRGRKLKP